MSCGSEVALRYVVVTAITPLTATASVSRTMNGIVGWLGSPTGSVTVPRTPVGDENSIAPAAEPAGTVTVPDIAKSDRPLGTGIERVWELFGPAKDTVPGRPAWVPVRTVLGPAGAATGAGVAAVAGKEVATRVEHTKVTVAAAAVASRRQVACELFIKDFVSRAAVDDCPRHRLSR